MSRRARPTDVAFAAAACIVLAGYNNLVGLRPWHRRWYPVVNGCAARAALGRRSGQRADRGRPWPAPGSAGGRAQAGIGSGRAGRGRVRAGRADPSRPAPAQRPADRRPGPAPARLPGAVAGTVGDLAAPVCTWPPTARDRLASALARPTDETGLGSEAGSHSHQTICLLASR